MHDDHTPLPEQPFRYGMSELLAALFACALEAYVFIELLKIASGKPTESIVSGMVFAITLVAGAGFLAARYCTTKKIEARGKRLGIFLLMNFLLFAMMPGIPLLFGLLAHVYRL
ncbi:MAG: hypothetical protein L6R28_00460 [Planctomycetes bacterium]|nr:hypothetical protein [Planctomycetota bacterium]